MSNDAVEILGLAFGIDLEAEVEVRGPFGPGLDFMLAEGVVLEMLLRVEFVEPLGRPRVAEPVVEGRGGLKGLGGIVPFSLIESSSAGGGSGEGENQTWLGCALCRCGGMWA